MSITGNASQPARAFVQTRLVQITIAMFRNLMEYWSTGVLECWKYSYCQLLCILALSITPLLHCSAKNSLSNEVDS